jgi:hypothetical protein
VYKKNPSDEWCPWAAFSALACDFPRMNIIAYYNLRKIKK